VLATAYAPRHLEASEPQTRGKPRRAVLTAILRRFALYIGLQGLQKVLQEIFAKKFCKGVLQICKEFCKGVLQRAFLQRILQSATAEKRRAS
jgi:hypothetical protein